MGSDPKDACTLPPLVFSEDVEQPPADEEQDIAQVIAIMRQTLQQQFERTGQRRRDVHVKSHGCASAEFTIRNGLPPELAQGLFVQPRALAAVVRFSNTSPWPQPDAIPDGRGLAVQVEHDLKSEDCLEPSQRTQDFVMVNNSTFIAANVKDYLRLEEARLQLTRQPVRLMTRVFTAAFNPLHWRCRALLAAARVASQLPSHPATYTYYSMVPIRYGRYVAKYRLVPSRQQPISLLGGAASFAMQSDAMRRLLRATLCQDPIRFEFQIQLRTSERLMPIEDATIEWPESESPFRTVADLCLPRQEIVDDKNAELERRAFSVWNGLLAHRPLGGINRVRRFAYAESASFRAALPSDHHA